MGHQISARHRPRRGSMGYWPRKRSKRAYPRVNWKVNVDSNLLKGFVGYKAGMTHINIIDNIKNSLTKGETVSYPVTVIETPPIKIIGVKFYKKTNYGLRCIGEVLAENLDKELSRSIILPKKKEGKTPKKLKDFEDKDFDEARVLISTQPKLTYLPKKKPELLEIGIGGDSKSQFTYAQQNLGKELRISDALKEGEQVDACSISKGKGFQGSVKRFGVKTLRHKAEKVKRKAGSMGAWHPAKTSYRNPQFGQMGYHSRTEYNKWLLKISNEDINPKGDFLNYGKVKNDYVILKGSVAGTRKRMIILRKALKPKRKIPSIPPEIDYISRESKQGN